MVPLKLHPYLRRGYDSLVPGSRLHGAPRYFRFSFYHIASHTWVTFLSSSRSLVQIYIKSTFVFFVSYVYVAHTVVSNDLIPLPGGLTRALNLRVVP